MAIRALKPSVEAFSSGLARTLTGDVAGRLKGEYLSGQVRGTAALESRARTLLAERAVDLAGRELEADMRSALGSGTYELLRHGQASETCLSRVLDVAAWERLFASLQEGGPATDVRLRLREWAGAAFVPWPSPATGLHADVARALDVGWTDGLNIRRADDRLPTSYEVDFVAGLFGAGVGALRAALSRQFRPLGLNVAVSAVWCHASPKVRMEVDGTRSCEIGDLLVVVDHRHDALLRRALLLQFKVADRRAHSDDQDLLYERWPPFRYTGGDRARRHVTPLRHAGALFAEVEHCETCDHVVAVDAGHLDRPLGQLSDQIAALMFGAGGREAQPPHPQNRNWERVVDDLIERARSRTFRYARRWHRRQAALRSDPLLAEERAFAAHTSFPGALPQAWAADARLQPEERAWLLETLPTGDGAPRVRDGGDDSRAPLVEVGDRDDDLAVPLLLIDVTR